MLKHKLLLLLMILCLKATAQDYSYQFEGVLSELDQQKLIERIQATEAFDQVKIQLKETSGQLFFSIIPVSNKREAEDTYTIATIKKLLIEFNLKPLQLVERQK